MTSRAPGTLFVSIGFLVLVSACGGPAPGDGNGSPTDGDPVAGPTLAGVVQGWPGGTDVFEVTDRGPFFFPIGGGVITTLATGAIASDGGFEVTLPGVPSGAFVTLDQDAVSTFGCDASGIEIDPVGARVLLAGFSVEAGSSVARGWQQGSSTLFVAPEPDDYWVFYAYSDRDVSIEGSENCPAIPFSLTYDLAFSEGWNTFTAVFVSQTEARNYVVASGPAPPASVWFLPNWGD
jgi:hypothetical protein